MTAINPRQRLSNPRLYVASWLAINGTSVRHGTLWCPDGRQRNEIEDTMCLDYAQQLAAFNNGAEADERVRGFTTQQLLQAVSEYIANSKLEERKAAVKAIVFEPEVVARGTEELRRWVQAVEATPSELTLAVLQHWIWMVKRKLAGLSVVHHILPILVGSAQGRGKSTAIKRLISPLSAVSKELDANFFTDERKSFTFGSTFIGLLDELANLKKAELAQVKRIITLDALTARRMGTNDVYVVQQNTSFIGTSNTSVGLIVNDTQMRRFYEINSAAKIDWDAVNEIDYLAVFRAVDEGRERGYLEGALLEELYTSQQELATAEPLQMFVEELELRPGTEKQVQCPALYEKYRTWCDENGMMPLNSAWFTKRMKALGFEQRRLRKKKVFWLSGECAIGAPDVYQGPATVHAIGGEHG